jgi:tRNA dimethylallyltransferase
MKKLLIICGPTGTGKTDLAIYLASKYNGEVVSADSRQVYESLDIGTGKDLPKNIDSKSLLSSLSKFYEIQNIKIWGYDLVDAKHDFNVSEYEDQITKVIDNILERDKLPILTGGTGLYIKSIVDGIETASISQNPSLRKSLATKTPQELYEILAQFDSLKAASMNQSDRNNPRRLVRAIEVAESGFKKSSRERVKYNTLFVGLFSDKEFMKSQIDKRVQKRLDEGLVDEIKGLLEKGITWNDHSMSSLGYKEWKDFFESKKSKDDILKEWKQNEMSYIKRQMVWFKKDSRINWFDISESNYKENVEKMVKKWYSS